MCVKHGGYSTTLIPFLEPNPCPLLISRRLVEDGHMIPSGSESSITQITLSKEGLKEAIDLLGVFRHRSAIEGEFSDLLVVLRHVSAVQTDQTCWWSSDCGRQIHLSLFPAGSSTLPPHKLQTYLAEGSYNFLAMREQRPRSF